MERQKFVQSLSKKEKPDRQSLLQGIEEVQSVLYKEENLGFDKREIKSNAEYSEIFNQFNSIHINIEGLSKRQLAVGRIIYNCVGALEKQFDIKNAVSVFHEIIDFIHNYGDSDNKLFSIQEYCFLTQALNELGHYVRMSDEEFREKVKEKVGDWESTYGKRMSLDGKTRLAKKIHGREDVVSFRIDDAKADYFYIETKDRGPGSVIIGDDGSYLFGTSAISHDNLIKEFKDGKRSKK